MIRILFLFMALVSFKATISGQSKNNYSILLRATTSVAGGEYFINILLHNDSTKLILKIKNHIKKAELEADTNAVRYIRILQSIKNPIADNDTVKTYLAKLDSIHLSYTVYDTDSLIVLNAKNEDYFNLIQEVLNAPTEILENKNHAVLDGTWMNFKLTNNGIERTVYAHSPTLTSNPILYKLITETTALYRKTKQNDFLNKSRTYGY